MSIDSSNLHCLLNVKSGTTNRAKFALWSLYNWCIAKEALDGNVSVIDQKSSPWLSEFDLSDNDWFVVRFLHPTVLDSDPFDIFFQATDAWSLDRAPLGERGLFVQMGYHTSGIAWDIVSHQFVANTYLFPVESTQLAQVGVFLGEVSSVSLLNVVGDDNWLVFLADTSYEKQNYDASFVCGHYGRAYKSARPPLMLVTGNMSRSAPGSPKDSDLACGWYMTAATLAAGSEEDISGNGNDGTPVGNLVLDSVLAPNTTLYGVSHDWQGGGIIGTSSILVSDTPGSWQVGAGGAPFTISLWCQLACGSDRRTLLSCSDDNVVNNGVFYVYADSTTFYWMFSGAAATLIVAKSALENKMHHVVFTCGSVGEIVCLYIDGRLVMSTTRSSIFGAYSYYAGRYLTLGAAAESSDPALVSYPWCGPIADIAFYTTAKSHAWVNEQYTRSVMFSPNFYSPRDRSGLLSWDHVYGGYGVFQFESIDANKLTTSESQPNVAYTPNKYNDAQILLKTVVDSSGNGGLAGGVLPVRTSYGKNNRIRAYDGESRFIAGDDPYYDCALSVIGNGDAPGSL